MKNLPHNFPRILKNMLSAGTIGKLATLPFPLLWVIILYYLGFPAFRRYHNDLKSCLKLTIFRDALAYKFSDYKYIPSFSNDYIIGNLVPFLYRIKTKLIPGYGTRHDNNSLWLVKQPERKPSDPILIYLHGGGYFLQTTPSQIVSMLAIYKLLDPEAQSRLSILHLDYKLTSKGFHVPHQLNQLHETYEALVKAGSTNIILCGDSAGGNLAVGYTQYLKKSGSTLVQPTALILISPWLDIKPTDDNWQPTRSYYENEKRDMIRFGAFKGDMLKEGFGTVDRSDPIYCPAQHPINKADWDIDCYKDANHSVFMVCGEDESLRDEALRWAEAVLDVPLFSAVLYGNSEGKYDPRIHHFHRDGDTKHCRTDVYVEPWGIHDAVFVFENPVMSKINAAEAKGLKLGYADLDEKYFGIKRAAKFLNDTIDRS